MDDINWIVDAKEAITVSLVTSDGGVQTINSFHPKFAYAIFGKDEEIFGYKDLDIKLQYHASDMRPLLTIKYGKKFNSIGETEPADIEGALKDFLPPVAFQRRSDFAKALEHQDEGWTPPGELADSFENQGDHFEVWKATLTHPTTKQLMKRIQILVTFFIEGGTFDYLDDPDADRWTVFFLYRKRPVAGKYGHFAYVFAGYTTAYRYFFLQTPPSPQSDKDTGAQHAPKEVEVPDGTFDLAALPCRTRISQFLVIPTFQKRGLGSMLYSSVYQHYLQHSQTVEITVEDPNEEFDELRDIGDMRFLRGTPDFMALKINTELTIDKKGKAPSNIVNKELAEVVRKKYKIAPRQFARVLEMHLMSTLPESVRVESAREVAHRPTKEEEHAHRLWALLAKQRLYRQNQDILGQMEIPERIQKLEETLSNISFEYAGILAKVDKYSEAAAKASHRAKRQMDEEDEGPPAKKVRVEA